MAFTEEERRQRHRESNRKWKEKNREAENARRRQWGKNNPEKIASYRASPQFRYILLKYAAKKRKLLLTLTEEQYIALVVGASCHYCSGPLPKYGAGLDRLNNSLGYAPENVVPCCAECNSIRSDILTVEETKVVISALKAYRLSK